MSDPDKVYLLDSSALLALIEKEAGWQRVERILRKERVIIPSVVLLEVYYKTFQTKGEDVADARYAILRAMRAEFPSEISEPVLLTAGRFKALHNISLADALIGSYAFSSNAILVHKDPEYEGLKGSVEEERLPYKKRRRQSSKQ